MVGEDQLDALIVKDSASRKKWVKKVRDWGFLDLSKRKKGEKIEIRTHPTEYHLEIVDGNSRSIIVRSLIDENFGDGYLCTFVCSMWVDPHGTLEQRWEDVGVKIVGYLVKNFCPVVRKDNKFHVLPQVIQVVIDGEELFARENGDTQP